MGITGGLHGCYKGVANVKGVFPSYGVDVKGYGVDVKGHSVDVKSYIVDVKGCYGVQLRAFVWMIRAMVWILRAIHHHHSSSSSSRIVKTKIVPKEQFFVTILIPMPRANFLSFHFSAFLSHATYQTCIV